MRNSTKRARTESMWTPGARIFEHTSIHGQVDVIPLACKTLTEMRGIIEAADGALAKAQVVRHRWSAPESPEHGPDGKPWASDRINLKLRWKAPSAQIVYQSTEMHRKMRCLILSVDPIDERIVSLIIDEAEDGPFEPRRVNATQTATAIIDMFEDALCRAPHLSATVRPNKGPITAAILRNLEHDREYVVDAPTPYSRIMAWEDKKAQKGRRLENEGVPHSCAVRLVHKRSMNRRMNLEMKMRLENHLIDPRIMDDVEKLRILAANPSRQSGIKG